MKPSVILNIKLQTLLDMRRFAKGFAKTLAGSEVILLSGTLGAGKTTFVQELVKAFGNKEVVTSPTFVLRNDYKISKSKNIRKLIHIDLYRLEKESPEDLDFLEGVGELDSVFCIEWPERLKNLNKLKGSLVYLTLNIEKNNVRSVQLRG